MKIKEVVYSKTFGMPQSKDPFEKIMLVGELEEGETPRQALYALRKEAHEFHYESNKAAEKQNGIQTQPVKEEQISPEARIIAQIYGASDLKVLESFKLLSRNNKTIEAAYNQRLNQLQYQ